MVRLIHTKFPTYPHFSQRFSLASDQLTVPPARYGDFLYDVMGAFKDFFLRQYRCESIEEAHKKVLREFDRRIGLKSKEHPPHLIERFKPFRAYLEGNISSERTTLQRRYVNREIIGRHVYGNDNYQPVSFEDSRKQLREYIQRFSNVLERTFPDRRKKFPCRSRRKPITTHNFSLNLALGSFPLNALNANIVLSNGGMIGNYALPIIEITTEQVYGNLRLVKPLNDCLSDIVNEYYNPDAREEIKREHRPV
jgi:hypothetical protein